jgi:hypothetical protein
MSGHPFYTQSRTNAGEVTLEDCRDYVRTGRCKYGGSCKYSHPTNVQSGGGLRGPIDPSEPIFPIRPDEPICQYYLKHGTCKFGQACKFNHPPHGQQPLKTVINGTNSAAVLINIGRNEGHQQLLFDQVATDSNGNLMMLQFLPQRPDEPDCIYFLKNGRCKYGGTCRYHHPVNLNQRRSNSGSTSGDVQRRNRSNSQEQYRATPNVQYVSQIVPAFSQSTRSEGPVIYYNDDGPPATQAYKTVQIVSASDGAASFGVPINDIAAGSSASSLASSFEMAGSNMERLGDTSGSIWNQARRHGSGGSLNTNNADVSSQACMQKLHNVASEGNIRQRLRASSYGSDCNGSQYDTSTMTSATSLQSMSRNTSAGSWRNERQPEPLHRQSQTIQQLHSASTPRSPQGRDQAVGRRTSPPGRGQRSEENEEGLTMMTSALLNMLDTTEEAGVGFEVDEDQRYPTASYHSAPRALQEQFEKMSTHLDNQNEYRGRPPPGLGVTDNPSGSSWSVTMQGQPNQNFTHRTLSNDHLDSLIDPLSQDADIGLYFPYSTNCHFI